MKAESKAKVILEVLSEYEISISQGVCSEYYASLESGFNNLVSQMRTIISEDDSFISAILVDDKSSLRDRILAAISILKAFISENKPHFLKTTLENAVDFKDEGLFNISAYCVRLYAEGILKISASKKIVIGDRDTLGSVWWNLKQEGIIQQDFYQKHKKEIDRLNSIVHQDEDCKNNPPNTYEMTDLIRWAKIFENDIDNLTWDSQV